MLENNHIYVHRDVMAILNLLRFDNIPEGRGGHIQICLDEEVFELRRYEEQICLGISIPVQSAQDYCVFNLAVDEIAAEEPLLQVLSSEDALKMRLWLPCHEENDYRPAVSIGIKRLFAICEKLGEEMLGCVYEEMKPIFEEALAGKGNDVDN